MSLAAFDFASLFGSAETPIVAFDINRTVLFVNEAARNLFRFQEIETHLAPIHCYELIHRLQQKPERCICGFGTDQVQLRRIYEPSINRLFDLIYIPLGTDKDILGAVNIYRPVEMPKELESPELEKMLGEIDFPPVEVPCETTFDNLTEKEQEVLKLIKSGSSNIDICNTLSITDNTVNYHIKNLLQKLGAFNRTHAAAMAFKRDLEQSQLQYREMCHRVKNHFNILHGLVALRAQALSDDKSKDILNWMSTQIRSLSALHGLLMNTNAQGCIPIRSLCNDLLIHLQSLIPDPKIQLHWHIDDVLLHKELALPCLQIIIELTFNAIKHAFPDQENGSIAVRLSWLRDKNVFRLSVEDNGVGMPANPNPAPGSLGMKIIPALVAQIGGTLNIQRNKGTSVSVDFADDKRK